MRLKSYVTVDTGETKHYVGIADSKNNKDFDRIPMPKWIEISEEPDGFHLFHYNSDNVCIADTWHETLEEAKKQANFEFEIKEKDWEYK